MVVFTCNNCGDSLQKSKVAKHYQFQCRSSISLTCVDCLKDFLNDEYISHVKCLSEAERYGGKNFKVKRSANRGERKQQEWIDIVNYVIRTSKSLSEDERNFLQSISKYQNIPRKKAKYLNFVNNALGYRVNFHIAESCWDKMESTYKASTGHQILNEDSKNDDHSNNSNNNNSHHSFENYNNKSNNTGKDKRSNANEEENLSLEVGNNYECFENSGKKNENSKRRNGDDLKKIPKKKRKKFTNTEVALNDDDDCPQNFNCTKKNEESYWKTQSKLDNGMYSAVHDASFDKKNAKFDWKSEILQIFESHKEMPLKKLKKKIVKKYLNEYPNVSKEKIEIKFSKKLKKIVQLTIVDDDIVKHNV